MLKKRLLKLVEFGKREKTHYLLNGGKEPNPWKTSLQEVTILTVFVQFVNHFTLNSVGFMGVFLMYLFGSFIGDFYFRRQLFMEIRRIRWVVITSIFRTVVFAFAFFMPELTGKYLMLSVAGLALVVAGRFFFYNEQNRRPKTFYEVLNTFLFLDLIIEKLDNSPKEKKKPSNFNLWMQKLITGLKKG